MIVLFVILGVLCFSLCLFILMSATTSIHEVISVLMCTNFILCLVGFQLCRVSKQMRAKGKDS